MSSRPNQYSLNDLLLVMNRLRDPLSGCPWDLKQDFESITPSTLEEAYEVVDAIERQDLTQLREELGDLLFQVVFYAQLADEQKKFSFMEIVDEITSKLIRRHPHVFHDGDLAARHPKDSPVTADQVTVTWEDLKKSEREDKGKHGILDDIPLALPALSRAAKLQKRASRVGFDWSQANSIVKKIHEELAELEAELESPEKVEKIQEELGDLIFTCVNLVRYLAFDPEQTLRRANSKFERRFRYMEKRINESGNAIENATQEEMETYWEQAKVNEL